MNSLAKNSLYNIVYQFLNLIFPLLSSMYVARIIMEDGIGKVAYAQSIVAYFIAIAVLGFPAYGIREISKVRNDVENSSKVFNELFIINAISTIIASILYVGLIVAVIGFRDNILLYCCVGVALFINFANIDWLYQGMEDYKYITIRSLVVKILAFISLLLFVKEKNDYINYALISSSGIACNYFFNLYHAKKYIRFSFNVKKLNLKQHLKPLMILAVTAFLGTIYSQIDVTMLGIMTTDSVIGYYANSHKIILIAVSCCIAVTTVFMPRLSFYYKNNKPAFDELVVFGSKLIIFIVVPATFGLVLVASDIVILLFGESFSPAGITLAIFAPMLLIRPLGDLLCYQVLISAGREQKRLYTSLAATIVNILLNLFFIQLWKQNGAAIASVIAEVVINCFLLKEVLKIVDIKIAKDFIFKILVASFVVVLVVINIKVMVQSIFFRVIIEILGGVLTYIFINIMLKNEVILKLMRKM